MRTRAARRTRGRGARRPAIDRDSQPHAPVHALRGGSAVLRSSDSRSSSYRRAALSPEDAALFPRDAVEWAQRSAHGGTPRRRARRRGLSRVDLGRSIGRVNHPEPSQRSPSRPPRNRGSRTSGSSTGRPGRVSPLRRRGRRWTGPRPPRWRPAMHPRFPARPRRPDRGRPHHPPPPRPPHPLRPRRARRPRGPTG